ncbi:unnamed protein product, partial [Mesorhabditis belari]|uniref:Uncharacterized protein n=1 Tax=Mesorhabditis belari TaxID=2138241 RepID=A0AAF3ER74_9BILA
MREQSKTKIHLTTLYDFAKDNYKLYKEWMVEHFKQTCDDLTEDENVLEDVYVELVSVEKSLFQSGS